MVPKDRRALVRGDWCMKDLRDEQCHNHSVRYRVKIVNLYLVTDFTYPSRGHKSGWEVTIKIRHVSWIKQK